MSTKAQIAQIMYNEMVQFNATKEEIIREFQTNPELQMTPLGAQTYYYNCRRVANGGTFNVTSSGGSGEGRKRDVGFDYSPDVEDERPLYTVVTPGDSEDGKTLIVASTHSYYNPQDALSKTKYDQFVVEGLPEIGENVDNLTPYQAA